MTFECTTAVVNLGGCVSACGCKFVSTASSYRLKFVFLVVEFEMEIISTADCVRICYRQVWALNDIRDEMKFWNVYEPT